MYWGLWDSGTLGLLVASYVGKEYILGNKIVELVKQYNPEKKVISSSTSPYSEKWRNAWNKYLSDNKGKNKDAWEIADWNISLVSAKQQEAVPTSFIDACERHSETRVIGPSSALYQQVLNWCTTTTILKVSEMIKDQGKRILNDSDAKTDENSGWKVALIKYLKVSGNPLGIEGIEGIAEKLKQEPLGDLQPAMNSFIKQCQALGEKINGVTGEDVSKLIDHCSVDRSVQDLIGDEYSNKKFVDFSKIQNTDPIAIELYGRYESKNKDKDLHQDEWGLENWHNLRIKNKQVPAGFFEKCKAKASTAAQKVEAKTIKEVVNYCTFDQSRSVDYGKDRTAK